MLRHIDNDFLTWVTVEQSRKISKDVWRIKWKYLKKGRIITKRKLVLVWNEYSEDPLFLAIQDIENIWNDFVKDCLENDFLDYV